MGEVKATLDLENTSDGDLAADGKIVPSEVRRYSLSAVVDTGAAMLVLPQEVVEHLGLKRRGKSVVISADDRRAEWEIAGPLTLRIGSRYGIFECLVGPPASTALLGQIPLERLDLIFDPLKQNLAVRPESPLLPLLQVR